MFSRRTEDDNLRHTFQQFDADGSGFITREELAAAMKQVDPAVTPEEVKKEKKKKNKIKKKQKKRNNKRDKKDKNRKLFTKCLKNFDYLEL